jgi:signal transduction histidine kinase
MGRKTIWTLAVVMFLAICWLVNIQASDVNTLLSLRKQQFTKQVMQSLSGVVSDLERREVVDQVSNDVIAVSFDTAASVSHHILLDGSGFVIVDSLRKDTASGTVFSKGGDSLYYPVTGNYDKPFSIDYRSNGKERIQDQIIKNIQRNKTVFVENIVNNLIRKRVNIEERVDVGTLEKLLSQNLKNNGVDMDFCFAVMKEDKTIFCRSEDYDLQDDEVTKYELKLFPNDDIISPECYISVYFPMERKLTFLSIKKNLIASLAFSLIIIGIFTFTLIIIFRQKKLSEMRNDFVNNMTHELKTPISSISLASQMLKDPAVAKNEASFSQITSVIEQECKKLGFQVERVLQMAAIDKSRHVMKIKEIFLNELIEKVAKSFELKIKDKGGELKCVFNAKDDLIEGDEIHIGNLVSSLIDNALKYTEGTPELKIQTSNVKKGVEIAVSDNGIGISHEDQKKIFDQFFRVHTGNIHNVKGFGIGLSYVKKVVDEHHGTIKLKSEINKGTTFFIYLPFNQ